MDFDDATAARPETLDQAEGRRRSTPAVTSGMVSATRARVAEALSRPDGRQAGQDILGILRASPAEARPAPVVAAPVAAAPIVTAPPAPVEPLRKRPEPTPEPVRPERTATPAGVSTTVRFPPKKGARRLMGTVLVLVLLATAGAGYLAYDQPGPVTTGLAATLGVLLLVTWAVRAGTPLTRMAVKGGQLDIRQGGLHLKFDLSSHYTPIEVQGTPGQRDWRVLFGRGTMRPFVVDSSIVDPNDFMEVLWRYRPAE